jgi:predicted RecA/RadA family phage recombinase
MKNFIQTGSAITVSAPAAVTSGEGVLIGSLFGISQGSALAGEDVVLATTGVFEMPKALTDSLAVGDPVYFNSAARIVTAADAGNAKIGVAVSGAGNPSATVRVRLTV